MDSLSLLTSILVGGGATMVATQILKSKYIPIPAERYPQATAVTVSLISSIIAEYQAGISVDIHNISGLATVFVGTLWIAISVYNHLNTSNK